MSKWDTWELHDYQQVIEQARDVASELYVILGELDAPEEVLDNCLAITDSTKPPYATLLPFVKEQQISFDDTSIDRIDADLIKSMFVTLGLFIAVGCACIATKSAEPLWLCFLWFVIKQGFY